MRRAWAVALMALALAAPASAHSDGLPVGPADLAYHWNWDPWIWAPLLLAHWLYGRGVLRAWARAGVGRIVAQWRVGAFFAGEILLAAALLSPLDPLGETLLSAHMVQHILLAAAAPLLLVLGAPVTAWTWAMPMAWRRVGRSGPVRASMKLWQALSAPLTASLLHGATLWAWHAPALFDAALRDETVHTLEHAFFFVGGLFFWSAMSRRTAPPHVAAGLIVATFMHMGVLSAVLALSPAPFYAYGDRPMLWGLSAIEDQQLAGLIMWAPAGGIYLAALAFFASRLFPPEPDSSRESQGIIRASTSSRSMK